MLALPYRTVYLLRVCHTPPLGQFSKVDCSTTKRVPIPNDALGKLSARRFECRPFWQRHYYVIVQLLIYTAVEISSLENRTRGAWYRPSYHAYVCTYLVLLLVRLFFFFFSWSFTCLHDIAVSRDIVLLCCQVLLAVICFFCCFILAARFGTLGPFCSPSAFSFWFMFVYRLDFWQRHVNARDTRGLVLGVCSLMSMLRLFLDENFLDFVLPDKHYAT